MSEFAGGGTVDCSWACWERAWRIPNRMASRSRAIRSRAGKLDEERDMIIEIIVNMATKGNEAMVLLNFY